ncbi:MAG: hypothetical protein ACI4TM_00925 [Candidatus Cryptobacteroides sp.]
MKKFKTIILPAVILSMAACQKAEIKFDDKQETGQGLVFNAFLADTLQSKSYFQNTDGAQHMMVWSSYDCIGIYNYTAELTSGSAEKINGAKTAGPSINSEDKTMASFTAPSDKVWTKDGVSEYYFYSYYPELGENVKAESNGVVSGFSIPATQSEGFGKYHLCSVESPAVVNSDKMDSPIGLNFSPRTALFTIVPYVNSDNADFDKVVLKTVKATFDGKDKNGNDYYVSCDYSLNLSDGSLTQAGNGSKTIAMDMSAYYKTNGLNTAIKEGGSGKAAKIDIVVFPVDGFTGSVTFDFETTTTLISVPSVTKEINSKSFKAGGHYTSKLNITPSYASSSETLADANSYIVDATSVTSLAIPLTQGAKGWAAIDSYNKNILNTASSYEDEYFNAVAEGVNAEILWSENAELTISATQNGNCLNVELTGAVNGSNAVIAIRDAAGEKILWSWHLWFTDYNPDNVIDSATGQVTKGWVHKYKGALWETGGIYADKYIMDRNLGATITNFSGVGLPSSQTAPDEKYAGLYYQWGRKDPFTINTAVTTKTAVGGVTLEDGVWNPDTFYTRDSDEDWAKRGSGNVDRWAGKSETVLPKSAFDPCPAGWRVPINSKSEAKVEYNTWSDFAVSGNFKGRQFGYYYTGANNGTCGNASYPVTGRISRASFSISAPNVGFLWSASPQPDFAGEFGVARAFSTPAYTWSDTAVASIAVISRASAMPVRCIKE